jgi:hypothetical protein
MPKKQITISALVIILIAGGILLLDKIGDKSSKDGLEQPFLEIEEEALFQNMSPEVARILKEKVQILSLLAQDETMLSAIGACPENLEMSEEEILSKDRQWINSQTLEDLGVCLDSEASRTLIAFSEENPEFVEIGLSDKVGLMVALTNKTTDYYQADETWWHKSYNEGNGEVYIDELTYDESAETSSLGIAIPVFGENGETLGIIKAILSVGGLQQELEELNSRSSLI